VDFQTIVDRVSPYHCLLKPEVEIPAILDTFSRTRAQSFLEIGTYRGATCAAIAMAFPDAQITTVDLPDPSKALFNPQGSAMTGIALRELGITHVKQLWMDSADLGSLKGSHEFDMVFADGDHSEAVVSRDLELGSELLAAGGILLVHDYTDENDADRPDWTQSVGRAVDEFRARRGFIKERLPGWLVALHQPIMGTA